MGEFLLIVVAVVVLWNIIKNKAEEKERERRSREAYEEEARLKEKYPDGYRFYKNRLDPSVRGHFQYGTRTAEEICSLRAKIIEQQREVDLQKKNNLQAYETFNAKQNEFNTLCVAIKMLKCTSFGNFQYSIPWKKSLTTGTPSINVRQLYLTGICFDQSLDYSHLQDNQKKINDLPKFKEGTYFWKDIVYEKINSFLCELAKKHSIGILLNYTIKDWSEEALKKQYEKISRDIPNTQIFNLFTNFNDLVKGIIPNEVNFLVVIDAYTENAELVQNCKELLKRENPPCILYFSLLKCYEKEEMEKAISAKIKYDEEKRIEEEIKQEEERLKRMHTTSELKCYFEVATRKWLKLENYNLPYFAPYYYYPTSCDWEANDDEWEVRNLVWNFKANPHNRLYGIEDRFKKDNADKKITKLISGCISTLIEKEYLHELTLVCLPASTAEVTNRRYEFFAKTVCEELGLQNAFEYVEVVEDGEAKHTGGIKHSKVRLDENFFKGKFIILFDDIITSGKTMVSYKQKLESLGAHVVGGLAIGKTRHEEQESNPIDNIESYAYDILNDLPF